MENLNKLSSNAKTTEVDTVSSGIISEFDKTDWSSDAYLTGIFGILKPTTVQLSQAISRIKAESILEEKDEQRDNKVRAVYYIVLGFMQHPDAAISSAAKKVDAVFEHYGMSIVSESYATESSLIKSMLGDFDSPEIKAAIALLPGLTQIVDDLKAAQAAFEEAQLSFQNEKAVEGNKENATAIKQKVLSIINDKIVIYLNAMIQVDEAKYSGLGGTIAQIISDMNSDIKKRKKNPEPANAAPATGN